MYIFTIEECILNTLDFQALNLPKNERKAIRFTRFFYIIHIYLFILKYKYIEK